MYEKLRAIGVLGCLVSTALFMAAGLTDHWVDGDNGHWGLWEICEETRHHNDTMNATKSTTPSTRTPGFGHDFGMFSTTQKIETHKEKDEKDKDDDDEDPCAPLDITSLPAYLHFVRGMVLLSGIVLAWGILSSRSLQLKVPRGDSFFDSHLSELFGCIACALSWIAVRIFEENYDSFHENTFINSHLGWSIGLMRFSIYIYFPVALFMMSPSLHEKYRSRSCDLDCDFSISHLCVKRSVSRRSPTSTHRRSYSDVEIGGAGHSIRRSSLLDFNGSVSNHVAEATHDHSFQMSETGSDIFTVTISDGDGNILPPGGSDLPQYEDVARSGSGGFGVGGGGPSVLPPPPSYDEVVSGGYLSFSQSAPPAPPLPAYSISTSELETSSESGNSESSSGSTSTLPLPPPYQYNDSNV